MKLKIKPLALTLGTIIGAYIFLLGMAAMLGWGEELVRIIGTFYIGYGPTFLGALIGGVYGFIDGAIAGALIAFIYNKLQ